jgi:hypothetical protein
MEIGKVLALLLLLVMALLCRGNKLDPDILKEIFNNSQKVSVNAVNASKITLLVTYHRNETGDLVAQVKLGLVRIN